MLKKKSFLEIILFFFFFAFFSVSFYQAMFESLLGSDFLTKDQLRALDSYKYSAIDRSFTTKYVLSHYWNWCVQFFPMNMA